MLMEHRNPPSIITGRLPYVFTRTLLIGPEIKDRNIKKGIRYFLVTVKSVTGHLRI